MRKAGRKRPIKRRRMASGGRAAPKRRIKRGGGRTRPVPARRRMAVGGRTPSPGNQLVGSCTAELVTTGDLGMPGSSYYVIGHDGCGINATATLNEHCAGYSIPGPGQSCQCNCIGGATTAPRGGGGRKKPRARTNLKVNRGGRRKPPAMKRGRGVTPNRRMASGGGTNSVLDKKSIHPSTAINAKCVSLIGQIACEEYGCNWNFSENTCQ